MKIRKYITLGLIAGMTWSLFTGCGNEADVPEKEKTEDIYVDQFEVDEIYSFAFVVSDRMLMVDKTDAGWGIMGDTSSVFDEEKVEAFLGEMSNMKAIEEVENPKDMSEYGVDQPTQLLAVLYEDGESITYCFGKETEEGCYVQVTDTETPKNSEKVFLVDSSIVNETLNKDASSFQ